MRVDDVDGNNCRALPATAEQNSKNRVAFLNSSSLVPSYDPARRGASSTSWSATAPPMFSPRYVQYLPSGVPPNLLQPNATQRSSPPPQIPPPTLGANDTTAMTAPLCAATCLAFAFAPTSPRHSPSSAPHLVTYAHHLRHQSRVTPLPTPLSIERLAPDLPFISPQANSHAQSLTTIPPQTFPCHSNHRPRSWRCASCCRGTRRRCGWGHAPPWTAW